MKWAKGITAIYLADLGRNPATINKATGQLYLNRRIVKHLSADQIYFIILHELSHLLLRTDDEERVDRHAFKMYAKEKRSLKASVYALSDTLNMNDPNHLKRAVLQLRRAQKIDSKN